jgi:plastocyanin
MVAAILAGAARANAATTKTVRIYGSTFSPKSVTITAGDTIKWVNKDNDSHQVYADHGQFVSAILKPNQSFSFTFKAAGTYTYKDELHPRIRGTIVVKGAPPTLTLVASSGFAVAGDKVTLRKVQLNSRSGARVAVTLPKGLNHLRLAMSVNAAGAGLLGATSPVLNWRQK